jgi:leucyl aminopeptidase
MLALFGEQPVPALVLGIGRGLPSVIAPDKVFGQGAGGEAALGWLLAQYRFDRYRPAKTGAALPQLKAPEGCDARRLEIIAAAEWLTRDLINTPANDMGPDALEEAFLALAARSGRRRR